jgi:2-polyprenyl-6-methoxyphenol hydroxylase-like FAD-dependent oxidoreductase
MNVLVSGAGVAGLALAHWLRRHDISVTVVERAPSPRTGGQAIDVRGAAREVVTRMGIMDAVRARHTGTHGLAYLDARGRRVAAMGGDAFGDSGGAVAEIEILRTDLVDILAATAGTEVAYGDVITSLADGPEGVDVTFRHRAPQRFDAVVGADGIRSGVRALAFGPEAAFVRELGTYTAYFPARTGLELDGWELMYNLPGGRVCLLYPVGRSGEVRVLLAFRSAAPVDGAPRDVLRRVFADAGWEIPALLGQMGDDLYFARNGFVRVDGWSRGRAVLLGDAAYGGSVGMGTSMALVGAYVLAGELGPAQRVLATGDRSAPEVAAAFGRYEDAMRAYVAANHKRDPNVDKGFAPLTRRGIWLRNQAIRLMTRLPGKSRMAGDLQRTANAITLADYPDMASI